jgi:uncharacterized protein YerC
MPTPWGKYPTPIGSVKERLLARCRQEDRGFDTPCLIWYGEKDKDGYGRIKDGGRYVQVHWVLDGKPPEGYDKDHKCHQRDCVRPSHLENVTRSVNTLRRQSSGARRSVTAAERQVAADMLRAGKTVASVADVTGLSRRTVGRIRKDAGLGDGAE